MGSWFTYKLHHALGHVKQHSRSSVDDGSAPKHSQALPVIPQPSPEPCLLQAGQQLSNLRMKHVTLGEKHEQWLQWKRGICLVVYEYSTYLQLQELKYISQSVYAIRPLLIFPPIAYPTFSTLTYSMGFRRHTLGSSGHTAKNLWALPSQRWDSSHPSVSN